ncbi:hypothetical protein, partial [Amycolatopsis decaplanina]|uniref:hypothetical protein n=1 Tax=Amycolatopsis decaplanina TaxID=208441 RepID=UPI001F2AE1D5
GDVRSAVSERLKTVGCRHVFGYWFVGVEVGVCVAESVCIDGSLEVAGRPPIVLEECRRFLAMSGPLCRNG